MKTFFFDFDILKTRARAWSAVGLALALILSSSPFVPFLTAWLRGHNLLRLSLTLLVLGFLGYILVFFISRLRIADLKAYFLVGLLLALGIFFMLSEDRSIEDRIHLVEYTFIALLFFKACKFGLRGVLLYVVAFLLTVTFGWIDELWQGFLPNRVYDIQDVYDNGVGGLIGIGFAWIRQTYGKEIT